MNQIKNLLKFRSGSHFGQRERIDGVDYYAVYSYGPHWPLALTRDGSVWLVNEDRYSQPTTNRHSSATRVALHDQVCVPISKSSLVDALAGRNRDALTHLNPLSAPAQMGMFEGVA